MSSQGRVELFYNGTWGRVCVNRWKLRDANVVCHQLGFGEAQSALTNTQSVFGWGKGNIWYYQLRCIGNESSLTDCGQGVWYSSSCSYHSNDAAVVCRTGTKSYKTVNLFIFFCQKLYNLQKVPIATRQASKQKYTLACFYSIHQLVWWKDGNPPEKGWYKFITTRLGAGFVLISGTKKMLTWLVG